MSTPSLLKNQIAMFGPPNTFGQSKSDGLRNRCYQHLVKKHRKTGSKLNDVRKSVSEGRKVAVAYVMVRPESLRHFVEDTIIAAESAQLTWNKDNPGGTRAGDR